MSLLSNIWAFLGSVGSHWAALVSGVLTFLVGMWFAHRGKTFGFGVFVAVSIAALLVACYQAWEGEYEKNLGKFIVSFDVPDVMELKNEEINTNMVFFNQTQSDLAIRKIVLARIKIDDHTPYRTLNSSSYCTRAIYIARDTSSNNYRVEGEDVLYSFMNSKGGEFHIRARQDSRRAAYVCGAGDRDRKIQQRRGMPGYFIYQ